MLSSLGTILRHKGPWGLAVALYYGAKMAVWPSLLGKRFIKKRIYDYRMLLDAQDQGISRTLLLFGSRELDHKIMLEEIASPGMTVLDIGANIGYYALMEQRLIGPEGRIIAVEPSPANAELLQRNLELNGCRNVTVVNCAISDTPGTRTFHLASQSNLGTFHPQGSGITHLTGKTLETPTRTVPELAAEFGVPDLIRMDVEGHEVEVINGMLEAVERGELSPMILFETHLSRYTADHDFEQPLRRLFACGYRIPLAATSSESGTRALKARGYEGGAPIATDFMARTLFRDIDPEHALEIICHSGGFRTVLLKKAD